MKLAGDRVQHGRILAASFFVGVVLSLFVLGTAAAYAGRVFATRWGAVFAVGAGVLSLVAGVLALFGPAVRRRISNPEVPKRGGVGGAFLYGLFFSVATITTSAGPLLLLLTVAAAVGRPVYGALLSLSFGIGRGAPFLLLGLFAGQLGGWLQRLERARRPVEILSGAALLVIGWYFFHLASQLG
jgi:cytochrome c-type biogenesis protein